MVPELEIIAFVAAVEDVSTGSAPPVEDDDTRAAVEDKVLLDGDPVLLLPLLRSTFVCPSVE